MKTIRILTMLIAISMHGCAADLFTGNQPIPPETVNELLTMSASIGSINPRHRPLPEDIDAQLESDQLNVYGGDLALSILPTEFVLENINSGDFYYAFSKNIGDDVFELLPNRREPFIPINETDVSLSGPLELLPGMEVLSDIADFYLEDSVVFVPIEATHLELRFLANGEADNPITIERWGLEVFYGYRMYIQPLIQNIL